MSLKMWWNALLGKNPKKEQVAPKKAAVPEPLEKTIGVLTCRHCNKRVRPGVQHLCLSGVPGSSAVAPKTATGNNENFALSYIVASTTDSVLMGYAVGGSLLGSMLGASMHSHAKSEGASDSWSKPENYNTRPSESDGSTRRDNSSLQQDPSPIYTPSYEPSSPACAPSYEPSSPSYSDSGSSSFGGCDSGSSSF